MAVTPAIEQRRIRRAKEASDKQVELELAEIELEEMARQVFSTDIAKAFIDKLKIAFMLKMQVSVPGAPEGMNFYREGQNDMIRYIEKCSKAVTV